MNQTKHASTLRQRDVPGCKRCCIVVGYRVYRSTILPRILGVLETVAGVGYATYLWPPLANYLYPYNLALGVGELAWVSGSWSLGSKLSDGKSKLR